MQSAAELASAELKALKERLSTVTRHSFRTPLTVIDGTARRLGRNAGTISPEEVRNRSETIRATVEKMVELVEHSIELTTLASCVVESHTTELFLADVIQQLIEEHEYENPDVNVIAWMNECPDLLVSDRRLVELILDKLFVVGGNLTKKNGRLDLICWCEGNFAVFSLKAIFEARALVDVKQLSEGLEKDGREQSTTLDQGINLNLIRLLIEQHSGELEIDTCEDRIEFEIRLPIHEGDESPVGPLIRPQTRSEDTNSKGV